MSPKNDEIKHEEHQDFEEKMIKILKNIQNFHI